MEATHSGFCRRAEFRQIEHNVKTPTLAEKLGMTAHISPLLQKARRLGLGPAALQTLAAQRGCAHYSTGNEPAEPLASEEQFSNEDLAIALLCVSLSYDPWSIRCGAAMVSAEGNTPTRLASRAIMERSVVPLRHVAEAGQKFEPENPFWKDLLKALPPSKPPKSGVLPHPTRYVAMTGLTREGPGLVVQWQRPRRRPPIAA
jgi:hypothetical protein